MVFLFLLLTISDNLVSVEDQRDANSCWKSVQMDVSDCLGTWLAAREGKLGLMEI